MTLMSQMPGTNIDKQFQIVKAITGKAKEIKAPPIDQLVAIATYVAVLAQESPDPEGLLMMFVMQIEEARKAKETMPDDFHAEECTKCGQCGKKFDEAGNLIFNGPNKIDEIIEQAMAVGIFSKPKKIES